MKKLAAGFLCCFTAIAAAEPPTSEPIKIAVPHITSLLEKDQSGVYQRIFNLALNKTDLNVKQLFMPYKRALTTFENGSVDCVFSFTKVLQEKFGEENILYSFPLGAFGYYMFTPAGSPPITDVSQLLSLKVGATTGHDSYFRSALNEGTKLSFVSSDEQNVTMLEMGRIDAMIAAVPDIYPFLPKLSFSSSHPLVFSFDRITCSKSNRNQAFLEKVSPALRAMKVNGSYNEIAGPLYVEFDESKW